MAAAAAPSPAPSAAEAKKWIMAKKRNREAPVRLLCLPWAGGNASTYMAWAKALPEVDVVPVQLPARMNRLREPALRDLRAAAEAVVAALVQLDLLAPPTRIAIFGHSLGARLAYEVALRLPAGTDLHCLVASGSNPPQLRWDSAPVADLPPAQFVQALRRRGGTPEEVLQSADMMALLEPAIRGDFAMLEGYEWAPPATPLACPLLTLSGRGDPGVLPAEMPRWAELTSGESTAHEIEGDHFFIASEPGKGAVLELLRGVLS